MRWPVVIALLLLCAPALAAPPLAPPSPRGGNFGLAMHGAPGYGPDDTHFAYANPDAPKGGAVELTHPAGFDTLNPFAIGGTPAPGLHLAYARLTARSWDEPFALYPLIAESVEVSEDRTTLTVRLRPGARFSDGAPVTADDVVFSFNALRDHGRPNMRGVYALARAQVLDAHTVRFVLHDAADREAAMILAMMPVLQQKWWAGRDFSAPLTEVPPTPGPYRIAAVDMGRSITYERIPDWWGADTLAGRGHNNFDRMTWRVVRDATTARAAVAKGEVAWRIEGDIAAWETADWGGAVTEVAPHARAGMLHGIFFNMRRPPLDDARVREALAMLFDADWVGRTVYRGRHTRTRSIFPNTDLSAPPGPDAPTGRAALRQASRMLQDAGWGAGPDGMRSKNGAPLRLTILAGNGPDAEIAAAYARMLRRAGVEAQVRRADAAVFARRLMDYDYDAVVHAWPSTLSPGTEQARFWSCAAAATPGHFNYAGVCTDESDALLTAIPRAATRQDLTQAARALDAAVRAQHIGVLLFHDGADRIARQPWVAHPAGHSPQGAVAETWWMDEATKGR
jgi:microcin C transport system substrate-binding protein